MCERRVRPFPLWLCCLFGPLITNQTAILNQACVASVSVRFRSKERGTRVKDRANMARVKERGGDENPVPRSFCAPKSNENASYAGYIKSQAGCA